jgi:hypothetical protein
MPNAATGQQLHQAGNDLVLQSLQRFIRWRGHFDKHGLNGLSIRAPIRAVQHKAMQVDVYSGLAAQPKRWINVAPPFDAAEALSKRLSEALPKA